MYAGRLQFQCCLLQIGVAALLPSTEGCFSQQ